MSPLQAQQTALLRFYKKEQKATTQLPPALNLYNQTHPLSNQNLKAARLIHRAAFFGDVNVIRDKDILLNMSFTDHAAIKRLAIIDNVISDKNNSNSFHFRTSTQFDKAHPEIAAMCKEYNATINTLMSNGHSEASFKTTLRYATQQQRAIVDKLNVINDIGADDNMINNVGLPNRLRDIRKPTV